MTPASEKRKSERMKTDVAFEYSVAILDHRNLRKVSSTGNSVDISMSGLGFVTDYPLEPGHVVRINRPNNSSQAFMVKWVNDYFGRYRVGGIFL